MCIARNELAFLNRRFIISWSSIIYWLRFGNIVHSLLYQILYVNIIVVLILFCTYTSGYSIYSTPLYDSHSDKGQVVFTYTWKEERETCMHVMAERRMANPLRQHWSQPWQWDMCFVSQHICQTLVPCCQNWMGTITQFSMSLIVCTPVFCLTHVFRTQ